jgi:N-methylhydantoinase A
MTLHDDRLHPYFESMGSMLGLGPGELAEGILDVANTAMERAIRVISVERGFDPREFTLLSFGGAGGMHAAFLAKMLDIPRVLIPPDPGILSALGMLMADVLRDYSQTVMLPAQDVSMGSLSTLFSPLEDQGRQDLTKERVSPRDMILEPHLDMRYRGQSFELIVPFEDNWEEAFHDKHKATYGYKDPGRPVEIVNLRLLARGKREKPTLSGPRQPSKGREKKVFAGEKRVVFSGDEISTPVLAREDILPGERFKGPAIVVEYSSTTVIPPFARGYADDHGNLILEIK